MSSSSESVASSAYPDVPRRSHCWPWGLRLLEHVSALLLLSILLLLLVSVISRYVFSLPVTWVDDVVSLLFLWVTMVGTVIAMQRNEHLRLTLFLKMLPVGWQRYVEAFALVSVAAFLLALIGPALEYAQDEWFITTPGIGIRNAYRVAALGIGIAAMLALTIAFMLRTLPKSVLGVAVLFVAAIGGLCFWLTPVLSASGAASMAIFLLGFVAIFLAAGVPIGFCFGLGALTYLTFSTQIPLSVVVSRMDEGMSNLILVSVPVFVLLGCVLDITGMGKAIVAFLASMFGHIRGGMSYVLLGALFIVSGISGSKVSDMATVAPALFPEMKRRGHKPGEMIALLGTGAAMADTVPPSIALIVLGSVTGVSIAALFQSGFVIAMVMLVALLALARWKARHEASSTEARPKLGMMGKLLLIAGPALVLPFLIRILVGEGIATATEVSTIAVLYALVAGHYLYGGISLRQCYAMLVDTVALSGAILLILGTASAMAWSITQSGVVQSISEQLISLPGGVVTFMVISILTFIVLGCVLEGLPAILLLAPIMFPIAKSLGIHEVHYAMVVIVAMNIGLMMPPIGIGFYVACRIGDAPPDEVMSAMWPYLFALFAGLIVVATVPWLSTVAI